MGTFALFTPLDQPHQTSADTIQSDPMGHQHGAPERLHRRRLRRHRASLDLPDHDQVGQEVEGRKRTAVLEACPGHAGCWYGTLSDGRHIPNLSPLRGHICLSITPCLCILAKREVPSERFDRP